MSRRIAELLDEHPAARAVLLAKHGLVTWGETGRGELPDDDRVRLARAARDRPAAEGPLRPRRRPSVAEADDDDAPSGCSSPRCRRSAARCSRTPTASSSRSTAARRPIAFASAARTPEVSQVGAPCPDHLINTKHRPLVVDFDPSREDEEALRARAPRAASPSTRPGTASYYERNLDDESGRSRSTRPGRASCSCRASASSRAGSDAGRARVARDLYHRAVSVEDAADAIGGFRLAQRGRGVRDRVLAARALQARPGAAARRARRPRRADHRRRERDRPRDRAAARRPRRARRRRRPERATAPPRSPTRSSPSTACAGRSPSRSTSPTSRRSCEMVRADGARLRRPRHPRRLGGPRDERAGDRDDARATGS